MDSIVPGIPLDLDRTRHLRLDTRAMLRAEREMCRVWETKVNLLAVLVNPTGLTLNDLAILLWASLLHEDPTLTLEQVQDLIDINKLGDISTAVFAAWNAATASVPGSPVPREDGEDPLAVPSTGAGSGAMREAALA